MKGHIGIVGAGIAGRLTALELDKRGWTVTLFDRDTEDAKKSCTWTGAGMLAPYCELETAEREVAELGFQSLELWPDFLSNLCKPVFFQQRGSLVVAHAKDFGEIRRLQTNMQAKIQDAGDFVETAMLEPELADHFPQGLFLSREAHLDNRELLQALAATIHVKNIVWHSSTPIKKIQAHLLENKSFDWVIDCRGLGAQNDLKNLRGIRGELIYVHAPDVHITRPIRLMHPRYPLYIVPRANHIYVIGATKIESEDMSPISVRSTMELLTAAYAVHTGFAEARIVDTSVNCRPAFPDNKPRIFYEPGLLRINGLYRHGFLVCPALVQFACDLIEKGIISDQAKPFVEKT